MNPSELIKDPLYQLNLMVFMSLGGGGQYVNPVFKKAGFSLYKIDQGLPVPVDIRKKISDRKFGIRSRPTPDTILEREEDKILLVVENKSNEFYPLSTDSHQARGLLSFDGVRLAEIATKPTGDIWTSIVSYLSQDPSCDIIIETLHALSKELGSCNVSTASIAAFGLSAREDGIYLRSANGSDSSIKMNLEEPTLVMELRSPHEDPRPLYLVPYCKDGSTHYEDVYGEAAFGEKIRAAILTLFREFGKEERRYSLDSIIIRSTTFDIWLYMSEEKKKTIRVFVTKFLKELRSRVLEETTYKLEISSQRELILPSATPQIVQKVRRYMRSHPYRQLELPLSGPLQGEINF